MIIEFSITNFRSIHQKQVFSMAANAARSKADNVFEQPISNGEKVSLTKAAVIYGANASGKSNLVRGLQALQMLVTNLFPDIEEPIKSYKPFLFDTASAKAPTTFEIIFIARNKEKYRYEITFNQDEILKEMLFSYPKKQARNLFTRPFEKNEKDPNLHIGRLGKELGNKKYKVHKKLPLLSLFGVAQDYHTDISIVYSYFKEFVIFVSPHFYANPRLPQLENELEKNKLERLIRACDTQIQGLRIVESALTDSENSISRTHKDLLAKHIVFEQGKTVGLYELPFNEESLGTNRLLGLGQFILKALEKGHLIVFDELDSSLHPYVSRFLVKLFFNSTSNPNNAQLIFTTHEPSILDKDLLRADQIWFTEKTAQGATEFFSAQDFDGVREDMPFDKWYMEGKFGAVPHISEIESIFGNGKTH
jgi:AAA15 family ATPase/GTPase